MSASNSHASCSGSDRRLLSRGRHLSESCLRSPACRHSREESHMNRRTFATVVVFLGLIAAGLAQEAPPKEPFKAMHLLNLKSEADVAAMLRGIADQNTVVEKMGIRDTKYRLYKVVGKQNGSYTYLMESS